MTLLGKFTKSISVAWNDITGKPTIPDVANYYNKIEVNELINGIELLPGPQGIQGIQGPTGPQGVAGSDASVTKVNVEAVLTGEISTHTHAGGSTPTSWGKYF